MSKGVVRLGDYYTEALPHFCIERSSNVFVNDKPICRKGDTFTEGKILTQGSNSVFVNGIGIARVGDTVSCGFKVIGGSSSVFSG